jgi:hypothetical protein
VDDSAIPGYVIISLMLAALWYEARNKGESGKRELQILFTFTVAYWLTFNVVSPDSSDGLDMALGFCVFFGTCFTVWKAFFSGSDDSD